MRLSASLLANLLNVSRNVFVVPGVRQGEKGVIHFKGLKTLQVFFTGSESFKKIHDVIVRDSLEGTITAVGPNSV